MRFNFAAMTTDLLTIQFCCYSKNTKLKSYLRYNEFYVKFFGLRKPTPDFTSILYLPLPLVSGNMSSATQHNFNKHVYVIRTKLTWRVKRLQHFQKKKEMLKHFCPFFLTDERRLFWREGTVRLGLQ